jgi:WD40 repeat protein
MRSLPTVQLKVFAVAGLVIALHFPRHAALAQEKIDQYGDALPKGAIARLGTVRFRHFSKIVEVAYSKDGRHFAMVGGPGFSVVNAADGKVLFRYHEAAPDGDWLPPTFNSIAYSPDGELLAASSFKQILFFDARTFERLDKIETTSSASGLRFSPDSCKLISFDSDSVSVWDRKGRQLSRHTLAEHVGSFTRDGIQQIALSPDGRIVYCGTHKKGVLRLDLENSEFMESFPGISDHLSLSPDGSLLAISEFRLDTKIKELPVNILDAKSGKVVRTLMCGCLPGTSIFSPDGRWLFTHNDDTLVAWNIANGRAVDKFPCWLGPINGMWHAKFSPDGQTLAIASFASAPAFIDVRNHRQKSLSDGHTWAVRNVAFHPDDEIITTIGLDGELRSWSVKDGELLVRKRMWEPVNRFYYRFPVFLALSPKGDRFLIEYNDQLVRLCETATLQTIREFPKRQIRFAQPFSPDGQHFVTGSGAGDVKVWHVDRATPIAELPAKKYKRGDTHYHAESASFLGDGKRVILQLDKFYEWTPFSKSQAKPIKTNFVEDTPAEIAISGNRTILAVSAGLTNGIYLWKLEKNEPLESCFFREDEHVGSIALSHDGALLAFSFDSRPEIMIRDIAEGKVVQTLKGPDGGTGTLTFSHDSRRIVSCHGDGTCLIWTVRRKSPE